MAKLYAKRHKRHAFIDCTGMPWTWTDNERLAATTTELRLLTCGACKGRILDVLRSSSWFDVPPEVLAFLDKLRGTVK